jgi:hypothetical protein
LRLPSACCRCAFAQGTAFTYQGKLAVGTNLATGLFDFRCSIFDVASGGSPLAGPTTNAAVGVTNGLFTTTLDSGSGVFTGDVRWLDIGVRTNGGGNFTPLAPRQQLTPTPYAMHAADAAAATSVNGPVSAAQLIGTISSNNIGAASITTAMLAAGAVGSNQLADGAVTAAKMNTVLAPIPTLLTTFTNPTPAILDLFGYAVAAVGNERVLIGAPYDDTGATDAGAAYLFSTNGTLLTVFTNPAPAINDAFGWSVTALGSDRVLIGAYTDNTGASDAGAAYLFRTDSYSPGLVADGVRAGSVTTASLADGAVTAAKLDSAIGVWTRSGDNVFQVTGNVGIGTNSPNERLVVLGNIYATGTITPNSDRNLKTGFEPVDVAAILEKVSQLPLQRWRFKTEPAGVNQLGPMAQDFQAAFGLGTLPTAIATVDADGVALAAIQGLNQKVDEQLKQRDTEIQALKQENTSLVARLAALENTVALLGQPAGPPGQHLGPTRSP